MRTKPQLQNVFSFLKEHHQSSENFERQEWQGSLGGARSRVERLYALLYCIANTQSKPKLDQLALFWKKLHNDYICEENPSISSFQKFLGIDTGKPLTDLYNGLRMQCGWGQKTAALFVKNVVNIHRSDLSRLHFFHDAKAQVRDIDTHERLYLPVDAVIKHIFYQGQSVPYNAFDSINGTLHDLTREDPANMLIWDDLWFWGFLTQKTTGKNRTIVWNEAKFWAMRSHSKDNIHTISKLASEFSRLVQT
jgi:hypothetical protein